MKAPVELQATARRLQDCWAQAFARKDWDQLVGMYTDRPAFWGSTPELHTDRAAVRAYFEALPPSLSAARYAAPHISPLGPDCFAASAEVVFVNRSKDGDAEMAFRMTQVFVRDGTDWRIAVHHASARPGPLLTA